MKICYFADGESIHVVRWCKHFANLGHEVHLISFKEVKIEGVQCHFVNTGNIAVSGGNWKVLLKYKQVKQLLNQIEPDIFHAHYATSYGITGALCNYHPYVITALGTDVLISPNQSKIYKRLLRFAFKRADWITAMADHMNVAIQKIGVPANKIQTVPFGIDPAVFNSKNRVLSSDTFVITSTRNFEKVYNIPHLLKAVALAKKEIPNIELKLIGAGSLKAELEQLIAELGIKKETIFLGKVPQPIIAEVLNTSHVFISVSLSDGNNISLNEAMACGCYCIATSIPANVQWIEDGVNGNLVEIDDVIDLAKKIVNSYKNYNTLQAKAQAMNEQRVSEKANWVNNMKQVELKYNALK